MNILNNSTKIGRVLAITFITLIFNLTSAFSAEPDSTVVIEHPLWEEDKPAFRTLESGSDRFASRLLIPSGENISTANNGCEWKTFYHDSLYIFLNTRYMRDHGRYYLIDLYIQNNSSKPLFFDFGEASVTGKGKTRPFWTYDRYLRRVGRQNSWAAFGVGATAMIGCWILDRALNGDYYDGYADYYSPGLDLMHSASSIFLQEISFLGAMAVADSFDRDYMRCTKKYMAFMSAYNIPANSSVGGHTLAKYIPGAEKVLINIPVGDKVYSFEWNTSDLEEVNGVDSI